jgi:hypothetical protein
VSVRHLFRCDSVRGLFGGWLRCDLGLGHQGEHRAGVFRWGDRRKP